jgi:hypothetical protein
MLNLSIGVQTRKYIKTKLKLSFHRQNFLSCCLIYSLGIYFEILSSLKAQSKCAVTKAVKIVQPCKNKVVSRIKI